MTVPAEKAPANSVPAAAVIRRVQALFGFTGHKERVGGLTSLMRKPWTQSRKCIGYCQTRVQEGRAEFQV